jgi:hypothetical protein
VAVNTGENSYAAYGAISGVNGRTARMMTGGGIQGAVTTTVTGKDAPTSAEASRAATLLRVLQGDAAMFSNPWWTAIWTTNSPTWPSAVGVLLII